jgi:hypothetical protein
MPDVFISYSQRDRDLAKALANFLSECGYDLWWDYELVGGVKFRDKIKAQLEAAKAAVVIWTRNSVDSDWVIEEAEDAKHSKKLIATRTKDLDYRNIPLGFRGLQTDLISEPGQILKALKSFGVAPSRPTSISKRGMSQVCIAGLEIGLNALSGVLDKAKAFAAAKKIDESVLLNTGLAADVFPFVRQVQVATDLAKNGAARLAGVEPFRFEDNEKTIDELKARLSRTVAFIKSLDPKAIDAATDRQIVFPLGPNNEVRCAPTIISTFLSCRTSTFISLPPTASCAIAGW